MEFADSFPPVGGRPEAMMGPRQIDQAALFYEFSLERHVPATHLLRSIDRFVDLSEIRSHLAPFYSSTGRPSIDPELLIRMLLVGYCFGIRSERRLCEEVPLNLAYRWFCRLGLDGEVPDHSTFSKNRHGRFRDCDLLRELFETVVRRCMAEGLVEGTAFAVDASLIVAHADKQRSAAGSDDLTGRPLPGRADPSGNISIPCMRLPGAQPARRYRSSSPGRIRPPNGPALTKGMPSLPTLTTT
jgi:transposase